MIGAGRFGMLAGRHIARSVPVYIHDPRVSLPRHPRIHKASLARAAACEIVVIAVPIGRMERLLHKIRPHLRPGALVIDVCSVKWYPVRWMKVLLPPAVDILGSHPLFGPDSAAQGVQGHTIVLCPVRISASRLAAVERRLKTAGVIPRRMDPRAHDRMMAESLLLTQFVGRWVGGARLTPWTNVTEAYDLLQTIVAVARHDSLQLLKDMWRFNPHAPLLARRLKRANARLMRTLTRPEY